MTAQEAINKLRIQLGETDATNSRWDDNPHLLFYLNQGRTEFSKQSEVVKALYQQTTNIGATLVGQNRFARYTLDPKLWEIDNVYWDDFEVESQGHNEWEEAIASRAPDEQGTPYLYRRIGSVIDLFYAPNEAKTLDVYASKLTTDLLLATVDTELNDDQIQAATDYATMMALMDDDRDGTLYLQKFQASVKRWKKKINHKGPRMVNIMREQWP